MTQNVIKRTDKGKYFENDAELRKFMDYFKNELPNPEQYPLKVLWLAKWWKLIVMRNKIK
jgi:hypothetical protein